MSCRMNCRYRRALSNNCTETTLLRYSPRRQKCPSQAPRGLQLFTSEGTLVATLERNVTFLVFLEEVKTPVHKQERVVCVAKGSAFGDACFFITAIGVSPDAFREAAALAY